MGWLHCFNAGSVPPLLSSMTPSFCRWLALITVSLLVTNADAQDACNDATGGYSTLIITVDEGTSVGLQPGDAIRAYTGDDLCVGATTWTGQRAAVLSIRRDDPTTRQPDGAIRGDSLHLVATSSRRSGPEALTLNVRALPDVPGDVDGVCCTYQDNMLWVADRGGPVGTVGEAGVARVTQRTSGAWATVSLARPLADPVVVTGPPSYDGTDPVAVRVRDVGPEGFEVQLDEWDYLDGKHVRETVPWMAVEAGTHTLADGRRVEAGHAMRVGDRWLSQTFSAGFDAPPVLLVQVVTVREAGAVAARVRSVTGSGFEVAIQREEGGEATAGPEMVAWVAVEADRGPGWSASGTAGVEYGVGLTTDVVTDAPFSIPFTAAFNEPPAVLAALQTADGLDPATLRATAVTGSEWSVFVEEEQSKDAEVRHTAEVVGWLALAPGLILGEGGPPQLATLPGTARSAAVATSASSLRPGSLAPDHVVLGDVYPNPTSGPAQIQFGLPSAGSVTIEVFDALGRRVHAVTDGPRSEGWHEADVGRVGLPPGLYVVRLQAGPVVVAKPFTIVR